MSDPNKVSEVDENKYITELKCMLSGDDPLKKLNWTDDYLRRYLKATDFDVQAAFDRMVDFYGILAKNPEWFAKFSPLQKKKIIERDIRILLDKTDKEGRPIYIIRLGNMDPSIMELVEDIVPVDDFFIEALFLHSNDIEKGICVIIDISNFSLKQMKWLTPHNIKLVVKRIFSMPIKNIQYHVVKNSMMINVAIKVIWPFLPQQIKDAVKFHFNDLESFYKYVDKDALPEDLGGKIKLDSSKQHSLVYEKNDEILKNFQTFRCSYLNLISSEIDKTDDTN